MMDTQHLIRGLNALSRAHGTDYFDNGHRGGAMLAAFFFCRENPVEEKVPGVLTRMIDQHWPRTGLCEPYPDESSDPALLTRLVETMQANMGGLREAGHNVILPALALKAFHHLPEAITASRVAGICELVQAFHKTDVPQAEDDSLPNLADTAGAAEFLLAEFVRCTERFQGRGQGWSGHLLTYGRALLDLCELGYVDLAEAALPGFRQYLRRIRLGPLDSDKPRPEHLRTDLSPLQTDYWTDRPGDWKLGHIIKYPYGLYGLLHLARNQEVQQACLAAAYRVL
ncbi:MAG: hypothetical protein OES79_05955 [Planctomycetota bacterium]|nr:hypothetical protein [Planctomycetota bacterium]